ncbi:MAG: neprosin family prolyl endopeptidase [Polyangiaceae bacterium]|nr:neprosin family prolyl endopeptidase [Polyangiaceae bacterium]
MRDRNRRVWTLRPYTAPVRVAERTVMGAYLGRTFAFLLLLPALSLMGACTITIGPYDDPEGTGSQNTSSVPTLPEPDNVQGEAWNLTPEQQARREEADRYVIEKVYKGYKILRTVQDEHGDIIDWIASDTMEQLPYPLPELPWTLDQLVFPDGVELAESELSRHPELFGPVGSTPFHRPMYWDYVLGETDATSVEDYLDHYQVHGQLAAVRRLYAGLVVDAPNRGLSGYMNQFEPRVEPWSLSIMEFAVACPAPEIGPAQELIGVVISVDKANGFGPNRYLHSDGKARLHVEYYRLVNGQLDFVWDVNKPGFVPNPASLYAIDSIVPVSTKGGTQVEHRVDIFQVPTTGDWWIAYNGWLLGYYPSSLFTLLNKGACSANWYVEVADQKPGLAWVETEVGTGEYGDQAVPGDAAWVRQPMYWDMNWLLQEPKIDRHMVPENKSCYTRSPLLDMGPLLGKRFLAGGPGGYNPQCTK